MPLEFQPQNTATEPRYDAETLRKVASLAHRLQAQHQDTMSAREIEDAGREVGLDPAFIRAALQQVTGAGATQAKSTEVLPAETGLLASSDLKRVLTAFTAAWWSAGWALPVFILADHNFGIGWIIYIGGGVFLSALVPDKKKSRRRSDDELEVTPRPTPAVLSRAAMLDVLFTLQRQLEGQKEHRAFLSVDVAGSTQMKLGASELAVEYSFGQLRDYIAAIVGGYGGIVQSHAGDGFMCSFRDDTAAVRAARDIQARIVELNGERNRLGQPFRLRCGVSAGEVAMEPGTPLGALHSTVIDRAASFQKSAEPGGIVLGPELAGPGLVELGNLSRLPEPVHGSPAFVWCGQGN